ncbi:MAG: hypothetical protein WDN08_17760 [Rhizomicrobium sp.]
MKHAWLGAAALTLVAQASSAGVVENKRLPDATFECSMWSGSFPMIMGNIRIKGLTFQGPAFDNKFEGGPYPYAMSGKVVLWKGPLGGLSSGGNRVAATVVTNNDPAKAAFDITVMSASGNAHSVNCSR